MELTTQWWLLAIGFTGQAFFFMRFFWQWIVSEREKRSIIPISFWYFSLLGSFFLLIYAILRRDIVFIVGQSTGSIIYTRNLYLIHRERVTARDRKARRADALSQAGQAPILPPEA